MNPISSLRSDTAPIQVLGACPHDCPDTCSMLTTVEDGIAIKVQGNPAHPHTDGALCTKVSRYTERTYHPERLLHPLKRVGPKGAGQFERVSWDDALQDIAARLKAIASRGADAAQAILPYSYAGTMGLVQGESMAGALLPPVGRLPAGPHHLRRGRWRRLDPDPGRQGRHAGRVFCRSPN